MLFGEPAGISCLPVDPPTQSLRPPERNIKARLTLWLPVVLGYGEGGYGEGG